MQKLRVESFSISIDGYGAGPNQDMDNPLGVGGQNLHQWFFPTKTFQQEVLGKNEGTTGVDNEFAERGFKNIGAWIMGRNMFSPYRGQPNTDWKGWWGDNPPYHSPVFILSNHKREPVEMEGGTIFYFVTEGIHSALEQAFKSANGKDVRLSGGVSTIRQYLTAKLIDEMHIAISPILLGKGEHLFSEIDLPTLGYACTDRVATDNATHIIIKKKTTSS
ncbi:Dihydrofolate reductase [Fodinibius roseus]|uniref:Dihydrofolate reductase n=1 Tax=Fodinibius roseus TaxID=1194090 RepID=A0A1M5HL36_9BACT|nr:Dihydrofolate reductase [Fodinibius roseus]